MQRTGANTGANQESRLSSLGEKIDCILTRLERMEARLDGLYEECQRTASTGQRMILRQEGLAKSLSRLETLLHER